MTAVVRSFAVLVAVAALACGKSGGESEKSGKPDKSTAAKVAGTQKGGKAKAAPGKTTELVSSVGLDRFRLTPSALFYYAHPKSVNMGYVDYVPRAGGKAVRFFERVEGYGRSIIPTEIGEHYWYIKKGEILRRPKSGGDPEVMVPLKKLSTMSRSPERLFLDGGKLYASVGEAKFVKGRPVRGPWHIFEVPTSAGADPVERVTIPNGPWTLRGGAVYYVRHDKDKPRGKRNVLVRVALDSGKSTVVASELPYSSSRAVSDAGFFFFPSQLSKGTLYRVSLDGKSHPPISISAGKDGSFRGMTAADDGTVYLATRVYMDKRCHLHRLSGDKLIELAAVPCPSNEFRFRPLTTDRTHVYWMVPAKKPIPGKIYRVRR
jgi:hypothetical protein